MKRIWVVTSILLGGFAITMLPALQGHAEGARAPRIPKKMLISVGRPDQADSAWAKDTCDFIHRTIFAWANTLPPASQCILLKGGETDTPALAQSRKSGEFAYHIQLRLLSTGERTLFVENLDREDDTDFTRMSWNIQADTGNPGSESWRLSVSKLLKNVFHYDLSRRQVKEFLLTNGLAESKRLKLTENRRFFDTRTGKEIDFETAYAVYREESPKQKHYLRAAIELAVALGLGTTNYWIDWRHNSRDWDYNLSSSVGNRLSGSAIRFDDNGFNINKGHAYAGVGYYMIARSNNLNTLDSFLFTFAASSAWEYISEYREVVSINDQILTPVGGFVLGEVLHQLGKAFRMRKPTAVNRMLSTVFDTPSAFNQWLDRNTSAANRDIAPYGYDRNIWSKFELTASLQTNAPAAGGSRPLNVGLDAEVINIPLLDEPGHVREILTDTVFAKLLIQQTANAAALDEFLLYAKATLAGYYEKNLGRSADGNLRGYTYFVGPSSAFEFRERLGSTTVKDQLAIVHILGASADITAHINGIKIRCVMDLYGDFAMIRSYAFGDYKSANGDEGVQSVLANQGYYYGAGYTGDLSISAAYERFHLGAAIRQSETDSINSRSRYSDAVTRNLDLHDSRRESEVYVGYQVSKNTEVRFSIQRIERSGDIDGFGDVTETETRHMGTLIYQF